ncbi:MAG: phosphoribosylanthranilate isomerase [Methylococcaceae bacterium]|nr:phosphoribosylanthranilate isomerase [Methylococcaceae bacterium]
MRTRVKICGFTRVEDAVLAARLGVDAIGLVFYAQSPRNVTITQAVQIVKALPAFTTVVGLFVDAEKAWIAEVLERVSVDCLQFHGEEPPEACDLFGKPYIKAIRVQKQTDITALAHDYRNAAGLLLDAYHPDAKGGTGLAFDWSLIPKQCALPVILAGGLLPENAKTAIQQCQPYALDVSSGVEVAKGIKDGAKMAAFLKEANEGDRS